MIYKNKHRPESIITWDWREQPCWIDLQLAVEHVLSFELKPVFIDFETGSDEHAVMVAPVGFTKDVAKMQYENSHAFFKDDSNEEEE